MKFERLGVGRMRRLIALLPLLLGGCSDRGIQACESYIKHSISAPATYKRVSTEIARKGDDEKVRIEYDASNAYGTPIRNVEDCDIPGARKMSVTEAELVGKTAADADRVSRLIGKPVDGCCGK